MQPGRIKELDVLRAVAVIMVLGRHVLVIPDTISAGPRVFFSVWREMGWIGVDLFFVLSGFLISGLIFSEYRKNGSFSAFRFLIRRGFKIYPGFYLLIAASFFLSSFSIPIPFDPNSFLGESIFLQNYLGAIWYHTWSLAVEEHFYALLSILCCVLISANRGGANPFKFLPAIIISTAVILLVLRCVVGAANPAGAFDVTFGYTHYRIDSLFCGVFLAYLYHFKSGRLESFTRRFELLLFIAAVSVVAIPLLYPLTQSRVAYTVGFTLLYLGFGAALMLTLFSGSRAKAWLIGKSAPVLAPIGKASYSIYLWHMAVYYVTFRVIPLGESGSGFYSQVAIYFTLSILGGMFVFHLLELPFLALRDKLFPK